jgi:hypothetical protein
MPKSKRSALLASHLSRNGHRQRLASAVLRDLARAEVARAAMSSSAIFPQRAQTNAAALASIQEEADKNSVLDVLFLSATDLEATIVQWILRRQRPGEGVEKTEMTGNFTRHRGRDGGITSTTRGVDKAPRFPPRFDCLPTVRCFSGRCSWDPMMTKPLYA